MAKGTNAKQTDEVVETVAEETTEVTAEKVEETKAEKKTEETARETPKAVESEYIVAEFVGNAKTLFNTRSECVAAALKTAGVTSCTISKAKEIVRDFLKKEVK